MNTTAWAAFQLWEGAALHVCMQIKVHYGKCRHNLPPEGDEAQRPQGKSLMVYRIPKRSEESFKTSAQRFLWYHLFKSTSVVWVKVIPVSSLKKKKNSSCFLKDVISRRIFIMLRFKGPGLMWCLLNMTEYLSQQGRKNWDFKNYFKILLHFNKI